MKTIKMNKYSSAAHPEYCYAAGKTYNNVDDKVATALKKAGACEIVDSDNEVDDKVATALKKAGACEIVDSDNEVEKALGEPTHPLLEGKSEGDRKNFIPGESDK